MPEEILEQTAASTEVTGLEAGTPNDETTAKPADAEPTNPDTDLDEEQPRKMGGFQKRIAKLSAKLTTSEAEKEYWREQALRTKPIETKVEAPAEVKEPQPEDFDTVADYLKAVRQYDREELKRELTGEIEKRETAKVQQSEKKTIEQKWSARLAEARTKFEDFDEVIADAQESNIPVSQAMSDVLMHSDIGAEMLYELAKDHELAAKIARMSPLEAAKALGKIEARIESSKPKEQAEADEPAKPPAPVTKAPAPVTPVKRTANAPVDLETANFKDFVKAREAHLQRK